MGQAHLETGVDVTPLLLHIKYNIKSGNPSGLGMETEEANLDSLTRPDGQDYVTINGVSFRHREVAAVVDDFYGRIQRDPVLKVPFQSVHDWPAHVDRLTHFWWMKFGGRPYLNVQYDPVTPHFLAGFNAALLSRWLTIFHDVLRAHLDTAQSELWELVSIRMGQGLSLKNDYLLQENLHERRQRAFGSGTEPQNKDP